MLADSVELQAACVLRDVGSRELNINVQTFSKTPPTPPPGASLSGEGMVHCIHFNYVCLGQYRLNRHMEHCCDHSGGNGKHKCEWCEYSTDRSDCLACHRRSHTGERPYGCL